MNSVLSCCKTLAINFYDCPHGCLTWKGGKFISRNTTQLGTAIASTAAKLCMFCIFWSKTNSWLEVGICWTTVFVGFFAFYFCRFCVVIRFSSLPQRLMTSDFEGFSSPDFIHYIYFPILILEKEPVFPYLMFNAKQGNYWYHFNNVFGMTRSLAGAWIWNLPHPKPALYHYAIEEAIELLWNCIFSLT